MTAQIYDRLTYNGELTSFFADWLTSVLQIPKSKNILYAHTGFKSVYEQRILVKIEKGIVIKMQTFDNSEKSYADSQQRRQNFLDKENEGSQPKN